jgi:hypothetical protein
MFLPPYPKQVDRAGACLSVETNGRPLGLAPLLSPRSLVDNQKTEGEGERDRERNGGHGSSGELC